MKKAEELSNEPILSPEPFVVTIPNNISRVNIDQYLKDVQDQRRKGLNYSYTTDDEEDVTIDEEPIKEDRPVKNEPWTEVNVSSQLFSQGVLS